MELRKCTDVSLKNPVYFELYNDPGAPVLDVLKADDEKFYVAINQVVIEYNEFLTLITRAKQFVEDELD